MILDLGAILGAVAWPTLALGVFIILYRHRRVLCEFFKPILGRVNKVSVGSFSFELAALQPLTVNWIDPALGDLRQPTSVDPIPSSAAPALLEALRLNIPSDYLVLDLGDGENWLTSRVFILSLLLERMRGLKCLVFVETQYEVEKRFVGLTSPASLRWAFAQKFPWMEHHFAQAYGSLEFIVASTSGRLGALFDSQNPTPSGELLNEYLRLLQLPPEPPTDPTNSEEWVQVQNDGGWEHARWLNALMLQNIMGDSLSRAFVNKPELEWASRAGKVRRMFVNPGPFIPLVNMDRRFDSLVDRTLIGDHLIKHLLESESE